MHDADKIVHSSVAPTPEHSSNFFKDAYNSAVNLVHEHPLEASAVAVTAATATAVLLTRGRALSGLIKEEATSEARFVPGTFSSMFPDAGAFKSVPFRDVTASMRTATGPDLMATNGPARIVADLSGIKDVRFGAALDDIGYSSVPYRTPLATMRSFDKNSEFSLWRRADEPAQIMKQISGLQVRFGDFRRSAAAV